MAAAMAASTSFNRSASNGALGSTMQPKGSLGNTMRSTMGLTEKSVGSRPLSPSRSLGSTMLSPLSRSGSASLPLWWHKYRPAPPHLVSEWRSLSIKAKDALGRAIEQLQKGVSNLHLGNSDLGDDGITVLSTALLKFENVRTLNVTGNRFGDVGATKLADALSQHPALEGLTLTNNSIGNAGAIQFAKVLERSRSVKTITFEHNRIGNLGASRLVAALATTKRTDISVVLADNPVKQFGPKALTNLATAAQTIKILCKKGVTLGQMLMVYNIGLEEHTIDPLKTSTAEVVYKMIMPATDKPRMSYVDVYDWEEGKKNALPMGYVIHAWSAPFRDLVRSVASHASGKKEPSLDLADPMYVFDPALLRKSYFVDAFCVNQHASIDPYRGLAMPDQLTFAMGDPACQIDKFHLISEQIQLRGGKSVLSMDSHSLILTRIQCLQEVYQAVEDEYSFDVVFSHLSVIPESQRKSLVQNSQASTEKLRIKFMDIIKEDFGPYDRFNNVIMAFMDKMVNLEFDQMIKNLARQQMKATMKEDDENSSAEGEE